MKRWKLIVAAVIVGGLLFATFYMDSLENYTINNTEEDAEIIITVTSKEYGDALLSLWNRSYPQQKGAVNYRVAANYLDETVDIIYGRMDELAAVKESLLPLATVFTDNEDYYLYQGEDIVFLPQHYEGLVFAYNKTMLNEMGISTIDADGDGLPEAFDTFEEILTLAESWDKERPVYKDKEISYVFPLAFNDSWSFYPLLTSGGWQFGDKSNPRYNQYQFLESLQFVYELGNQNWAFSNADGSWEYELVFSEESAPFSMMSYWMYHDEYQLYTQSEIKLARFPTYDGKQLRPLVYLYGYSVNAETLYPDTCQKLIELIQSDEGYQLLYDYSEMIPVIPRECYSHLDMSDQTVQQWLDSYRYSQVVDAAFNTAYQKELMEIIRMVFEHELEPETAQERIIELAEASAGEEE